MNKNTLISLKQELKGEMKLDALHKAIFSTDASVYRKTPLAVVFPKDQADIQKVIAFANTHKVGLIPRTAGTSLAGQCVGEGIVVDVSRHFTQIISVDEAKKQVVVQPGVIRDELNQYLEPFGLFFGPNTSTSNRCMVGGMVGNNSSGTTSIQYGVTRDKVVQIKGLLSDGSEVCFKTYSRTEIDEKSKGNTLEAKIYASLFKELVNKSVKEKICEEFPKPEIHRRNTGYAVDELLKSELFGGTEAGLNLCQLLSGSEGTLAFTTELTLQLDELPPKHAAMVVTQYRTLEDSLVDVAPLMQHRLFTCEMMDKVILDCTKNNRAQMANRFFVEGDPAALLMSEVRADSQEELQQEVDKLLHTVAESGLSYASPVLYGADIQKALELRKAGLGLLGNMVGDRKAVACIEDTAVALPDLKDFIMEFSEIMADFKQDAVYYAHAGAGELHLRPILDLKKSDDVKLFREITTAVAHLTKKYKGSFSGEHGDGIVRAEFIPLMIGDGNYQLLRRVKQIFDPNNIFNPGKIVDAFPMDEALRYEVDREEPELDTLMDFSDSQGYLRAAEKCNGSGDCRKTHLSKGAMCPSYHATKNEKDATRARANALREFITLTEKGKNPFDHPEIKEALDLCLSCKACASECPSNVDMAALKTEFLYQYQEKNGYGFRAKLFARNTQFNKLASKMPGLVNAVYGSPLGGLIKNVSGVASKRSFPKVYSKDFDKYLLNAEKENHADSKKVVLYVDEFTQYLDVQLGMDAIDLLSGLGYAVELFYAESGRTYLSKGFLKEAQKLAEDNTRNLLEFAQAGIPVVGLEPSAILSFRDEYPRLVQDAEAVSQVSANAYLIEEFLAKEAENGRIGPKMFTQETKEVKVHVHCHQKALSNQKVTFDVLNLPKNYTVRLINSGCCGMAGSFGYEKEHYEVSMAIGEQRLFPAVRKSAFETLIAANGTSCRHQIEDGTQREALHPVTILKNALK
ncbi:FAD-binding and (Fe-S)-binding domain-containing protein [Sediminicola luteus]|uniref:FAD-binding and (Fe-S)-binding domain-containing protein n=1 Tax=Sediminicola luteus TaxID=319238 RepID=UPI0037443677